MLKYFISGGAGFLGINLTRFLLEKGHTVVSFDIEKEVSVKSNRSAFYIPGE
jgi:nucleoside-diphosphate-sugar epimerase